MISHSYGRLSMVWKCSCHYLCKAEEIATWFEKSMSGGEPSFILINSAPVSVRSIKCPSKKINWKSGSGSRVAGIVHDFLFPWNVLKDGFRSGSAFIYLPRI
jgi:hypothetical protein